MLLTRCFISSITSIFISVVNSVNYMKLYVGIVCLSIICNKSTYTYFFVSYLGSFWVTLRRKYASGRLERVKLGWFVGRSRGENSGAGALQRPPEKWTVHFGRWGGGGGLAPRPGILTSVPEPPEFIWCSSRAQHWSPPVSNNATRRSRQTEILKETAPAIKHDIPKYITQRTPRYRTLDSTGATGPEWRRGAWTSFLVCRVRVGFIGVVVSCHPHW